MVDMDFRMVVFSFSNVIFNLTFSCRINTTANMSLSLD